MSLAPITLTWFKLTHFLSVSLHAYSLLPVEFSLAHAAGLQPLAGSERSAHPSLAEQHMSNSGWAWSGDKLCWPLAKQWPVRSVLLNTQNKQGEEKNRFLVTITVTKCSGGNEILEKIGWGFFLKECNCFHWFLGLFCAFMVLVSCFQPVRSFCLILHPAF